jgi:hypothetical protein
MTLRDAAQILANGVSSIGVYGTQPVDPWQVKQIAREWLELTKDAAWAAPAPMPTLWQRLFRRAAPGERGE